MVVQRVHNALTRLARLRLVSSERFAAVIWEDSFWSAFSYEAGELASPWHLCQLQQCRRVGHVPSITTTLALVGFRMVRERLRLVFSPV